MSNILHKEFWTSLRKGTRVRGDGKGWCEEWCEDALKDRKVRRTFHQEQLTWESQIDQYATSILSHHWLEGRVKGKRFVADGTAGQFSAEHNEGFYDYVEKAPERLKVIYQKKVT